jgi:hypothetical protein
MPRAMASAWPLASASMQAEPPGQFDQPARLAVALRPRHAEIMLQAGFRIGTLFGADDHHGNVSKPAEAADDCFVIGKGAVAGKRQEIGDKGGDAAGGFRALRMAGNLHLLPGGELGVERAELLVRLVGEAGHLVRNIDFAGGFHPP